MSCVVRISSETEINIICFLAAPTVLSLTLYVSTQWQRPSQKWEVIAAVIVVLLMCLREQSWRDCRANCEVISSRGHQLGLRKVKSRHDVSFRLVKNFMKANGEGEVLKSSVASRTNTRCSELDWAQRCRKNLTLL